MHRGTEHQRRVFRLLETVVSLPVHERQAILAGEPDDLRSEVLELLEQGEDELTLLERIRSLVAGGGQEERPAAPDQVGPYRIVERLGRGGMGEVYLAEQTEPVRRTVAVKVLATTSASRDHHARFLAERDAMGRLEHPNIVRILDGGTMPDGRPYLVMERIDGERIDLYCDRLRLPVEERLRLFVEVCRGVGHAHQRFVLHRDLKPSNVLVTEVDGRPMARLIDFGIAKWLDLGEDQGLTHEGFVGTPQYMSPEALGLGGAVDTRTDVFSLGVMLYELGSGVRPWSDRDVSSAELIRIRTKEEPRRPSTRLSALDPEIVDLIARRRGESPRSLQERLRGDLDWIAMKAIATSPDARYATAVDLAEDIERHLRREPVSARPPTMRYRASRFVRRNRLAVGGAALLAVSLVAGIVGTATGLVRARRQVAATRQALAEARAISDYMVDLFRLASPERHAAGEEVTARDLLSHARQVEAERFADQPAARARFLRAVGDSYENLGLYDEAVPHFEEARALLEPARGEEPDAYLDALFGIAFTRDRQGRFDESIALYEKALAFLDDHPELPATKWARILQGMGYVRHQQGRLDEAYDLIRRAAGIYSGAGAESREQYATVLGKLGVVAGARGDLEEAESLQRTSVAELERLLGPRHPSVATALNNLAVAQKRLGKLDEALATARRSLQLRREIYGNDHPHVASSLTNVAEFLLQLNRADEAESMWREALAIRVRLLGPDHPSIALLHNNLAAVADQRGDYATAAAELERALEIREAALGPDHPDVAKIRSNIGLVRFEAGDVAGAERQLDAAQKVLEARLGRDHPRSLRNLEYVALLQAFTGHLETAARTEAQVVAAYARTLPADHPDLAAARDQLASFNLDLGDPDRAETLIEQAWQARRDRVGADDPDRAATLLGRARVRLARHQLDDAERLAREALAIWTRAEGASHPDLVPVLGVLAAIDEAAGRPSEAEARYRRGIKILEARPVPPHLARPLLERYRDLLLRQGRSEAASRLPRMTP